MRLVIFQVVAAALLTAATVAAWNSRYRSDSRFPSFVLDDLILANPDMRDAGTGTFRIGEHPAGAESAWIQPLPGLQGADRLYLKLVIRARDLKQGAKPWQTGRASLEWKDPDGSLHLSYIGSVKESLASPSIPQVIHSPGSATRLSLRFDHLGRSGSFAVEQLEIFALRPSAAGLAACAAVVLGWIVWAASVAGSLRSWRVWVVALIWTGTAWKVVLPGPWATERPFAGEWSCGARPPSSDSLGVAGQSTVPVEKVSEEGGWILRVKLGLGALRPLLHGLLFMGPTLVFLFLIRRSRAILLVITLALGVEAVQFGFGFGSDSGDLLDLVWDGSGIGLACLIHSRWRKRRVTSP